jgi:hypothetical protein
MQILNIVLLVQSVGLSIAGLALIEKQKPMYTLVYPEKTARKVSIEKYFYAFSIMTILYFLLNCLGANHFYNTVLYFLLTAIIILYYSSWYNSLHIKEKKEINFWLLAFIGFAIGLNLIYIFMIPHLIVILSMLILTIFVVYSIIRLNDLGYKHYLFFYIYIWLANACFLNFFLSAVMRLFHISKVDIEFKLFDLNNLYGFSEIYVIIQYTLIFLMFLSILLLILDIKKHSPIYEKQYLEENKPKGFGNEINNSINAL